MNYDPETVSDQLQLRRIGANEGVVVALKILVDVVKNNEPPGCFIMSDKRAKCVAVSIYHLDGKQYTKMNDKDVYYVLDPYLKIVKLTYMSKVRLFNLHMQRFKFMAEFCAFVCRPSITSAYKLQNPIYSFVMDKSCRNRMPTQKSH